MTDDSAIGVRLAQVVAAQKAAYRNQGAPSARQREERIDRLIDILRRNEAPLLEALQADFGGARGETTSLFGDFAGSVIPLKAARRGIRKWMRPRSARPELPFGLLGARLRIELEPLGVVGVLGTWNFPLNTLLAPLGDAFAAGNSCIVKPSEVTPHTAQLLCQLINAAFDEQECFALSGGPEVARLLCAQPLDHLVFTGSTATGRRVAEQCARQLTPVTLELGGKSPVLLTQSARLDSAAERIAFAKILNSGQLCIAPDYCLVPASQLQAFSAALVAAFEKMLPSIAGNLEYTAIVNRHHYERLQALLAQARALGLEIIEINPGRERLYDRPPFRIAPTLVIAPPEDSALMSEEIFGPILPIIPYERLEEAIAYVQRRPAPLAFYPFGRDTAEIERLCAAIRCGGISINDCAAHVRNSAAPFGGVGASGQGALKGFHGFRNFSHERTVYRQTPLRLEKILFPPWGDRIKAMLRKVLHG
ncbi:aldehyde dehydrogenase family protein [Stutzerimonas kirkiae]|nr:aldehyde dehydrogenase family protein [Stutzerimonas kirkiae]